MHSITVKDVAILGGRLSQFAKDYQYMFSMKPLASLAARGAIYIDITNTERCDSIASLY